MKDTILSLLDSSSLSTEHLNKASQILTENKGQTTDIMTHIQLLFDNPILSKLLIPIGLLIFGWVLKHYYDKHFVLRPKLYLKMGSPLYNQRFLGYDEGYELSWPFECELKNNSKHDAYNISIKEINPQNISKRIISNKEELNTAFPSNNHLSSNKSIEFNIKKTIKIAPEVLINFTIEDGQRIILPGTKIREPHKALRPIELNNIKLVITYENEKGKKFYTKFKRVNSVEKNELKSRRPFLFRKLI